MSKKNILKYGVTAMGGTFLALVMVANVIANRGLHCYTDLEMREAEYDYETKEEKFTWLYDRLLDKANAKYVHSDKYYEISNKMYGLDCMNPEYEKLEKQLDSLKSGFVTRHLNEHNDELTRCRTAADKANEKYLNMLDVNYEYTKTMQKPFMTRLKNNWNDILCKYHTKKIQQHQMRLQKRQRIN